MYSNRKKFKIQGYTKSHKKSLVRSQALELIRNGRIKTTPTKAKVLRKEFDKLVTSYKKNTVSSKRKVNSFFRENKKSINKFENVVKEKLSDRNSGYTRIIKTLPRKGDNADQAYIMLVNTEFKEKESRLKKILDQNKEKKRVVEKVEAVKQERNTGRKTVLKRADKRRNSK